ncbi:hypothetical protein BBJ29_009331 [Phytophthora kernoviae]|uniref:60S ribosomal protein L29 n=1 Tax=Phytophthora kernoviae TaxID=325452 RepID=A0A3F2RCA7_9STRA|nr:hypothetical protein BBP00_00009571 [Phytophthora kernoviae]RLN57715.1 hypothetical protein BBJ29_009331 [Phytophthora kernoviae]
MVKQKNHTARNNTVKAHRNGIRKPKVHRFTSTRGLDPKFLRNQHWAKKFDKKHRNRKNKDSKVRPILTMDNRLDLKC